MTAGRSPDGPLGRPLIRAAVVALAMTAALGTILGVRAMRLQGGQEIILTSSPMDADDAAAGYGHATVARSFESTPVPIHVSSPARASLLANPDRFIGDGWVSLKPGRGGRPEIMRVSESPLGPQAGEVLLRAAYIRISSEEGAEPQVLISLPTLSHVAVDDHTAALFQPGRPLELVLSVTPDGRALFRRVQQGDTVLLAAPGLL